MLTKQTGIIFTTAILLSLHAFGYTNKKQMDKNESGSYELATFGAGLLLVC